MDIQADLDLATRAAHQAGEVVMGYYKEEYEVREKGAGNPVTDADLEADAVLKRILLGERPEDGWLSEETRDSPDRLSRSRVWIVDPIDGTKEFIKGIPQFAISIALAVEGEIAVAAIFNPARKELFTAVRGGGVWLNGKPVAVTECDALPQATILASRSEVARGEFERFKDYTIEPIGSIAYKLAMIGSGMADLTFTLTPKNEWDFAAGALLVTEGGGQVRVLGGHPQTFNQPDPLVKGVAATNARLFEPVMTLIGHADAI
ncbi:MAG: 3'(2'),5'-bisphosphate nucleotidase CysQ [Nitrospirota bacterium]|nr:3'(2'),5'-bisphosphate nucleotidase CysQ [Nitrospirota bacterium]